MRNYGSATLYGKEYTDLVCVLFSACVNDFEYFLVEQQTGLFEPIDGILGMARDLNHVFDLDLGKPSKLMIDAMIDESLISTRQFSFYFAR